MTGIERIGNREQGTGKMEQLVFCPPKTSNGKGSSWCFVHPKRVMTEGETGTSSALYEF